MSVSTGSKIPTDDCFSGPINRWPRLTAVVSLGQGVLYHHYLLYLLIMSFQNIYIYSENSLEIILFARSPVQWSNVFHKVISST